MTAVSVEPLSFQNRLQHVRSAARTGCQQAGIHTVGDFLEILRMRIEYQTGITRMHLLHNGQPDFRRIAYFEPSRR